jgi:hypothetical protein
MQFVLFFVVFSLVAAQNFDFNGIPGLGKKCSTKKCESGLEVAPVANIKFTSLGCSDFTGSSG